MRTILPVIKDIATSRSYKKGAIILYQGEVPRQAYVIRRGTVRTYRIDNHGNELTINFYTDGDVFPEAWLFGETTGTLFYYEALDNTEVYTIGRDDLLEIIEANPTAKETLFRHFIRSHTSSQLQVNALNQTRASDKVKLMLYFLLLRFGRQQKDGRYFIDFKITHTTFASLTGLTRETSTIELRKLKQSEIVDYTNSRFVIDRRALEASIGDDSFADINRGIIG